MSFERGRIDLDGSWRFIPDPDQGLAVDRLPPGEPMAIPSCWEATLGPTTPLTTGWFVRTFDIPEDWDGGRRVLRFGAVSYSADVWLNGLQVGSHEGAYTRFEFGVDGAVRVGANELVVRVVNPAGIIADYPTFDAESLAELDRVATEPSIREIPIGKQTWYSSMSGIWQHVELEHRAHTALGSVNVRADVAAGSVTVRWALERPEIDVPDRVELRLAIRDAAASPVMDAAIQDPSMSGEATLHLPEPHLWQLDDPHLYRLDAEVRVDGELVDRIETRFGVRDIDVADGRVTLNGRPIFVRGVLDQDVFDTTLWLAPSRDVVESELRRVKAMGLNLVRCHIKVPDPMYFEVADEIGLLVWAELPSWDRLTESSGDRARTTLREMVEQLHTHPSIAIWTIVNEDWGTDLRHQEHHRSWLRDTYDWLKALDPTRLVVDNSACWAPDGGNFHVATDIADYHMYFGMPDHADRWRAAVASFADRPDWLWSPHGDATPNGGEPLVLSEFGNWGLPRFGQITTEVGSNRSPADPSWWTRTGAGAARPAGVLERFSAQNLARVAEDADRLADATQRHQFDAMQFELGELRRHRAIAGYVVTELSDVFWEANGLLDLDRADKVFGDRLIDILGGDTVFADLERWDIWSGDIVEGVVHAQFADPVANRGCTATWRLSGDGLVTINGVVELPSGPGPFAASGRLAIEAPDVERTTAIDLDFELLGPDGDAVARQRYRLVLAPRAGRTTARRRSFTLDETLAATPLARALESAGHRIDDDARLLVTDRLNARAVAFAERGSQVLVVIDGQDVGFPWATEAWVSAGDGIGGRLARPVSVQSRHAAHDPVTGESLNLSGDWISSFAWADPRVFSTLPPRSLLDVAYSDVLPDLVLLGADDAAFATEVFAGSFVGWIAQPAAYAWTFQQGPGSITVTTLRLASPGPVARLMLDSIVQHASRPSGLDGTPNGGAAGLVTGSTSHRGSGVM